MCPPYSDCSEDCCWLISLLLPLDMWSMKVHVAWEHSSFKILDLVAIEVLILKLKNRARQNFGFFLFSSPKSLEGS